MAGIAIRKSATKEGVAAELVGLLENITADGVISDEEARDLRDWLELNRNENLPAIEFLRLTVEKIVASGDLSETDRKVIHQAAEKVLPPELRQGAKARRAAAELAARAQRAREKESSRQKANEERERNQPVCRENFMVAGVLHQNRASTIDNHLQPGQTVYFIREPENPHDGNAISIRLKDGHEIGYVPRDLARGLAPLLDQGLKHNAYCTKVLQGKRAPIPVVEVAILNQDAAEGISREQALAIAGQKKSASSGCAGCVGVALFAIALVAILITWVAVG